MKHRVIVGQRIINAKAKIPKLQESAGEIAGFVLFSRRLCKFIFSRLQISSESNKPIDRNSFEYFRFEESLLIFEKRRKKERTI